jgi:hypothetical protein
MFDVSGAGTNLVIDNNGGVARLATYDNSYAAQPLQFQSSSFNFVGPYGGEPGKITAGAINYAADAQASDTYVITLDPVPAAYQTGMQVIFKANTANTGAASLNVNSLGAKTIVKAVSTALANNDILAGMFCTVVYDGTNFVLMNPRTL